MTLLPFDPDRKVPPSPEPGLGDDIPCTECGSALDTGLECTECGADNYEVVTGKSWRPR